VIPTAFERIGHIVHLNLCNEQLKYKKIIAQIILDVRDKNILLFFKKMC
jgi:tRNA G37 N-methylase Trm5